MFQEIVFLVSYCDSLMGNYRESFVYLVLIALHNHYVVVKQLLIQGSERGVLSSLVYYGV